jgi:2-phosphosulfolactate phosphatase
MSKLHVISHKDELDPTLLAGKVVVVLDILFATSTIVTALDRGARCVVPAGDAETARGLAAEQPAGSHVLAGEHRAQRISGFGPFTPMALSATLTKDTSLIFVTTNGTVALKRAETAPYVYAGCLLNGAAIANHINNHHADDTVLLYCAGSRNRLALEDLVGAGHLVQRLTECRTDHWQLTDAALTAHMVYTGADVRQSLYRSRVGRMVAEMDLGAEVEYSAQMDTVVTIPRLTGGILWPESGDP